MLQRSQERPNDGDVFVLAPLDRGFYYGRVIRAQIEILPLIRMPNRKPNPDWMGALVYIYDEHASDKLPVPELARDKLLLPPLVLDWACWTQGYVESVESLPLMEPDVLPRHCFDDLNGHFVNEFGQRVQRTEPCGVYGLTPFRGLDDKVSRALGIPEAG